MDATMSFYRFAYRVGFQPGEDAKAHPPFAEKVSALFEREEAGCEPPYGSALDLGCSGMLGGRDPFGAPEVGPCAAEIIPEAALHLIPGAGHVPWVAHSGPVSKLAAPFLRTQQTNVNQTK